MAQYNLGDKVKHKTNDIEMIVVDFAKPINDMRLDAKDYTRPKCRYMNPITGNYQVETFDEIELTKA